MTNKPDEHDDDQDQEVFHYTVGRNPIADLLFDVAEDLIVTGEQPGVVVIRVGSEGGDSSVQWHGNPYLLLYALKHAVDLVAYDIARQPHADAAFKKIVMDNLPKN